MELNFISSNKAFNLTVANDKFIKDMESKILNAAKSGKYYIECEELTDYQIKFLSSLDYKVEKAFLSDKYGVYRGYVVSWNKTLEKAEDESDKPKNLAWWW